MVNGMVAPAHISRYVNTANNSGKRALCFWVARMPDQN